MMFSIDQINRKIPSLKRLKLGKPSIDPGKSDMTIAHTFKSSDRKLYVTAQDISKRWGISISTAVNTLKKTTQKFLRSTVLLASRRYRKDQVFTRMTLKGTVPQIQRTRYENHLKVIYIQKSLQIRRSYPTSIPRTGKMKRAMPSYYSARSLVY